MDDAATVSEAASDAANAVTQAAAIAGAETAETVAAVIAGATAQVEQAQQAAEDIARAAMETALGTRIDDTNRRLEECHVAVNGLQSQLANLNQTIAEMLALELAKLSLIPAPSAAPQAAMETTVAPEAQEPAPAPASESTAAAPKRKRKFFL